MITNCIKLHSSFQDNDVQQIGYVFNSRDEKHPVIHQMRFGNELYWNRDAIWKLVEKLPIVANKDTTVEHIVVIGHDRKVRPIISKYFDNGSIAVYSQIYKSGLSYLGYRSDNLSHNGYTHLSEEPIGTVICPRMIVPHLLGGQFNYVYPYVDTWMKNNNESNQISPVRDFWGRNTPNDFYLEDYYLPFIQPSNSFWCYKGRILSNGAAITIFDTDMIAKDLADTLQEAYREVKQGNYDESLLTDVLTDTLAPWKRQIYRDIDCKEITVQLGSMKQFVNGEMTIDKLLKLSATTAMNQSPVFEIQDAKNISDVNTYVKDFCINNITYSKEFASVLEYIQSIGLTDFCFMYDIQQFAVDYYTPEIVFMLNRYYPNNNFGNVFPYLPDIGNKDYKFKDRSEELGKLLCDWLCTNYTEILSNFTRLKLVRTYNEELFFYFDNTPMFADMKLMFYDLIGGIACGRNMCSTDMVQF